MAVTAEKGQGGGPDTIRITCTRCGYTFPFDGVPACPRCAEPVYSFCGNCKGCSLKR